MSAAWTAPTSCIFGVAPESAPVPLVLVFHGGGGHAATMPNFTHFDSLADHKKFLVAYPESFNKSWNDTRGLSPADDVGFISALIAELQRTPSKVTSNLFGINEP